jgi:integrase
MIGWVRANPGKKKTTYYVVIPWDRMDGSGKKKKWQFKYDRSGYRFESYPHAERFLNYLRSLIDSNEFNPLEWADGSPHKFEDLGHLYLQGYEEKYQDGKISPSTLAVKQRYINQYLTPFFRGRELRYVTDLTLNQFYSSLPPTLKAKTKFNFMSELQTFFRWLKSQKVIKGEIPRYTEMKDLKERAKEQRPAVKEETHLMPDEHFEVALNHIPKWHHPIFRFIRITGCRTSEACALQRNDVDWRNGVIDIRRTWVDHHEGGEILVHRPKSGSRRLIKLTQSIKDVLESIPPRLDTSFIFHPKEAAKYSRRKIDKLWRNALRKAGMEHMEFKNATRATFACQTLKLGHSYEAVGAVLGHKNVETTKRYGQICVDSTADLLERRERTGTNNAPNLRPGR